MNSLTVQTNIVIVSFFGNDNNSNNNDIIHIIDRSSEKNTRNSYTVSLMIKYKKRLTPLDTGGVDDDSRVMMMAAVRQWWCYNGGVDNFSIHFTPFH